VSGPGEVQGADRPVDGEAIRRDLAALGLRAGHHVLVHSSLSSIGRVDGGAAAVVDALVDVVGPDGTVVVPTLTGTPDDGAGRELVFDVDRTPGWTGAIPEELRRRPEAVRSAHPTHSVAAIGAAAARLTAGHEDCVTPCGQDSPYGRLAADPDGVVLLLGCGHASNTTLHLVEELAGVPYHLQREPVRAVLRFAAHTDVRDCWIHDWGTPRRFEAIEPLLVQRGLQVSGRVGAATARLLPAGPLVRLGVDVLRADPAFFVAPEAAR
jgi:aminoglycoside 3-N-acetyltransferase